MRPQACTTPHLTLPAAPDLPATGLPPVQGGSGEGDASEFLALTQQLAVSSVFAAVQCSFGPCLSVQHGGGGGGEAGQPAQQLAGQQPDMVLLVRFQEEAQLQAFLDCPPIAALLEVRKRGASGRLGPGGSPRRGSVGLAAVGSQSSGCLLLLRQHGFAQSPLPFPVLLVCTLSFLRHCCSGVFMGRIVRPL